MSTSSAYFWFSCHSSIQIIKKKVLNGACVGTAWKASVLGIFLIRFLPHLDWVQGYAECVSLYSVWTWENVEEKIFEYKHFSPNDGYVNIKFIS